MKDECIIQLPFNLLENTIYTQPSNPWYKFCKAEEDLIVLYSTAPTGKKEI